MSEFSQPFQRLERRAQHSRRVATHESNLQSSRGERGVIFEAATDANRIPSRVQASLRDASVNDRIPAVETAG
jgi:hypothetical protein